MGSHRVHNYISLCVYNIPYRLQQKLIFIVNLMGSHRLHTYIVPCMCSALAWWWLLYSRNM